MEWLAIIIALYGFCLMATAQALCSLQRRVRALERDNHAMLHILSQGGKKGGAT